MKLSNVKIKLKLDVAESTEPVELKPHQKYYRKNKVEMSAKKKARYDSDPAYREAIKDRSLRKHFEKKKQKQIESIKNLDDVKYEDKFMRTLYISDTKVRFYSTSAFADIIGKTSATINNWHRENILPTPSYLQSHGGKQDRKWYSEIFVKNICEVLTEMTYSGRNRLKEAVANKFLERPDMEFDDKVVITDAEREMLTEMYME
jgi:hypothetical protein